MYEEKFMKLALQQAKKATEIDETPIGCVIVQDDKVIARAYNKRETKKNCLCHAEVLAINKASKKLGGWRLPRCDMYVTLEPCPMCAGAIIASRIDNLYFGAYDKKSGVAKSVFNIFEDYKFNHQVNSSGGYLEKECSKILSDFFIELRNKKKQIKEK